MRASGNQISGRLLKYELCGLNDLPGFDAASAYLYTSGTAGGQLNANRLKVRIKATASFIVRV